MRSYPTDSPQAMARIVALALMADGAVEGSELKLLERQEIVSRLGLDEEQFDMIFYEFLEDMLVSAGRLPSGRLALDARVVKRLLREIGDPELQQKAIRLMLVIVNADHQLSAEEALLIAQALKCWKLDLFEVSDSSIPCHRPHDPALFTTIAVRESPVLN